MDPGHALHVRVTRSPEHYQPLCMPDASTLMCRCTRTYVCVCVCAFVYVRMCACMWSRRLHGYICEYIQPIHRHRKRVYRVGFRSGDGSGFSIRHGRSNGSYFRYRGVISREKISVHHRMPEKYFNTVWWCLYKHIYLYTYVH